MGPCLVGSVELEITWREVSGRGGVQRLGSPLSEVYAFCFVLSGIFELSILKSDVFTIKAF